MAPFPGHVSVAELPEEKHATAVDKWYAGHDGDPHPPTRLHTNLVINLGLRRTTDEVLVQGSNLWRSTFLGTAALLDLTARTPNKKTIFPHSDSNVQA